jgi:serine/threonine protein phosphatase 1
VRQRQIESIEGWTDAICTSREGKCLPGRILAIGDIHGCHVALDVLLAKVSPMADDTLVVLGDVVDRGPGTKQAIDRLLELDCVCCVVFILGNHEEMLFDALAGVAGVLDPWLAVGGRETLGSYGGTFDSIPEEHTAFLKSGLNYWQTDADIFIHANLEPGVPLERQTDDWLRWRKVSGAEPPHPSGKRIICGHTPTRTGLPQVFDGWVNIDTGAYRGLCLTCLDVGTDDFHQAAQTGEYRGVRNLSELL